MIKTWQERCEEHPDHEGIVTEQMIRDRMQEEIDALRQAIEQAEEQEPVAWLVDGKIKVRLDMAGKLYYSETNVYGKDVVDEAIEQEREACAKIVEAEASQYVEPTWAFEIINDIKARGEK